VPDDTTTASFVIDGTDYPIPTLDTFTMDEAQVLYDYAGCVLEDFAPAHPEWPAEEREAYEREQLAKVRNPAFKRALVHVAYQRGNPDLSRARVNETVGSVNVLEVTLALLQEDDAGPPELTELTSRSEPSRQPPSDTPSNPEDSGTPSPNGSALPDSLPVPTGISASAMSSHRFDLATPAA
jgi:hypothetical protein